MKKILDIYINELRDCTKDFGIMVFFILVPLGYPILYTYIYSNEVVRDIPVAVCDLSDSDASRSLLHKIDATPEIEITARCSNMLAARQSMQEDKVKGIIYIPQEFDKQLSRNEQTHISIYCSMASLFYYKAMLVACTDVSLAINKEIQIEKLTGTTARESEIITTPLQYEAIGIANPTTGFANFVIPAILVLILQQTLLLGIGMRIGTERERNLLPSPRGAAQTLAVIIGKSSAYLTIYAPITAYVLCVVPAIFSLSQLSRPLILAIFMLPYLLSCILFAISMGQLFVYNRETPMLLFVFTSIPLLFLSGISWPGSSIPLFWKIISYIFPSTFGINGFVSINETGATLADVRTEYYALWMQTIIYFVIATIVINIKKQKREKNSSKHRR